MRKNTDEKPEKYKRLPKDQWPDRYCSNCGKRRPGFTDRCPDCGDVQYGLNAGPQHQGWCRRHKVEPSLFGGD